MKFEELKKSYLNEAEDTPETPPEETLDPEAELQVKITEKMEEIGAIAVTELDKVIEDKTDIFIKKIQSVGIDEVLADFILQKFIPSLDNIDDKLFVTVNLEEFIMYLSMKFSEKLIGDKSIAGDKNEKKDAKIEEGIKVPKFPAEDEKFIFQLADYEHRSTGGTERMTMAQVAKANKELEKKGGKAEWLPADSNLKKKYKFKNNIETMKYIKDNYK